MLRGHRAALQDADFAPDGGHGVTAGGDGTARGFLVQLEDLRALAPARSARAFTAEERARFTELLRK